MPGLRMVPVRTGCDPFEAKVLAARLGAEGILWQLRGADTVYPVGPVDVLVPTEDLATARDLLAADLAAEADAPPSAASGGGGEPPGRPSPLQLALGITALLATGAFVLGRLLAL